MILSDAVADTFGDRPYPGGLTYSGHPLAAAAAVATLTAMEEEDVVGRAARLGADVFAPGLADLADRHEAVGEVRGTGVFWAVELVADRRTREPLPDAAVAGIVAECRARGLLALPNANRVHLVPPCTLAAGEARDALAILDEAMRKALGGSGEGAPGAGQG